MNKRVKRQNEEIKKKKRGENLIGLERNYCKKLKTPIQWKDAKLKSLYSNGSEHNQ